MSGARKTEHADTVRGAGDRSARLGGTRCCAFARSDDRRDGSRRGRVPGRCQVDPVVAEVSPRIVPKHRTEFVDFDAGAPGNSTESIVVAHDIGVVAVRAASRCVPVIVHRRRGGENEPFAVRVDSDRIDDAPQALLVRVDGDLRIGTRPLEPTQVVEPRIQVDGRSGYQQVEDPPIEILEDVGRTPAVLPRSDDLSPPGE